MMMRLVAKSANESMNMQTRPGHLFYPFNPLPIPYSLFLKLLIKEESQKHASIQLTSLPLSLCGPLARPIHPSILPSFRLLWFRIHWQVKRLFLPASPSVPASFPLSVSLHFPLSFLFLVAVKQIRSKRDCLCGTITIERARAASG